jgi:hypothetical protein
LNIAGRRRRTRWTGRGWRNGRNRRRNSGRTAGSGCRRRLLQTRAAIHQVLFNIPDHKLHFEIVGMLLGDLVQPVKNRFQARQIGDKFDLPIQIFQLI